MSSVGSITHWLNQLKAGDQAAAQQLWERYYQQLINLAWKKLCGRSRRAADEEDAVISAFDSFCRRAAEGRFPRLEDRDDLWQVLVMLTLRKVIRLVERESREKRGGGEVINASALEDGSDVTPLLERHFGKEPTPEFAAQVTEECERLMALLPEQQLREIAQWKMEGYTEKEMATRIGCQSRTIRRKVQRIRVLWEKEIKQ